ncbi:hypothetical protein AAII07_31915 [Microvirga sp. 0TCS3.31]
MKTAHEIIFSIIQGHEGSYDRHGIVRNTSPGVVTEHILEELAAEGFEIVKRGDAPVPEASAWRTPHEGRPSAYAKALGLEAITTTVETETGTEVVRDIRYENGQLLQAGLDRASAYWWLRGFDVGQARGEAKTFAELKAEIEKMRGRG